MGGTIGLSSEEKNRFLKKQPIQADTGESAHKKVVNELKFNDKLVKRKSNKTETSNKEIETDNWHGIVDSSYRM